MFNNKLPVVDLFLKRMNLADVAITQKPTKFINTNLWLQEKIVTGDDFFLLLEHLLEKKKSAEGSKGLLPRILSFIILCDCFVPILRP